MTSDNGFYSIINYTTDGPETQHRLIEAFAEILARICPTIPGE